MVDFSKHLKPKVDLFLDSGAYSAFSKGIEINIDDYIQFIKDNKGYVTVYANLDVIGDAKATLTNQKKMEAAGLNPIPTFHFGENISYLKSYVRDYDYIAIGGVAQLGSGGELVNFLDSCFNIICDKDGYPQCKTHGFAVTSIKNICRYPWFSVDSTAWVQTSRHGGIFMPSQREGKYVFDATGTKIQVSNRSPLESMKRDHLDWLKLHKPSVFEFVLAYFEEMKLPLGKSRLREESASYKLQSDEKWFGKDYKGRRLVEGVEEPGLCNDYRYRDEANIRFFLALEESRPEYPWRWVEKDVNGKEVKGRGRIKGFSLF